MRKRRGGKEDERKTKWQQHDVETKRKNGQSIYSGLVSLCIPKDNSKIIVLLVVVVTVM